jgi:PST family polysaccharide transporter
MVSYIALTTDSFVVGRWLGASALGLYTRALQLVWVPLWYLANITSGVLFPAMSEILNDAQRFRRAYLFGVQITVLIAGPLCAGMLVAAPHLITGLYGKQWSGAILPLQVLAAAGLFRAVYRLGGSVTYASGNVMAELWRQVGLSLIVAVGGAIGTVWGILGVSIAVAVATLFMYFAMAHLSLRIVGGQWRQFFEAHLAGLLLTVEVAAVAFAVRLSLERAGVGSIWIVIATITACTAWLPVGTYLLPRALRPTALFSRFNVPISQLPTPIRVPLVRILRLET